MFDSRLTDQGFVLQIYLAKVESIRVQGFIKALPVLDNCKARDGSRSSFRPPFLPASNSLHLPPWASWTLPNNCGYYLWPPLIKSGWLLFFLFGTSPSLSLGIPPVCTCWGVLTSFLTLLRGHWIKSWSFASGPMFSLFPCSKGWPRRLIIGVP